MQRINHEDMRRHLTHRIIGAVPPFTRHDLGISGPVVDAIVNVMMKYVDGAVILQPEMLGKSKRRGKFGVHEPWPVGLDPSAEQTDRG